MPQGSVLGPVLFANYMNVATYSVCLYAVKTLLLLFHTTTINKVNVQIACLLEKYPKIQIKMPLIKFVLFIVSLECFVH